MAPRRNASSSKTRDGRPQMPAFAIIHDSPGVAAWRRNESPGDRWSASPNSNTSRLHQQIPGIAARTGTYIELAHNGSTCLIWGTATATANAKSSLDLAITGNSRIPQSGKPSATWAKIYSPTTEARRIQQVALDREELKQKFRRNPPEDAVFESIGSFEWPHEKYPPKSVFGNNLEVLDPIREDCLCYIILDPESSNIQAMGEKLHVVTALARIRATLYQLVARHIVSSRTYVLHWPDPKRVSERVELIDYPDAQMRKGGSWFPQETGKTPRGRGRLSRVELYKKHVPEKHGYTVAKRVKDHIMQTLNKMKYYHGSITLRIRLGTFVLKRYEDKTGDHLRNGYPIAAFEAMLKKVEFEGIVTQGLGDGDIETKVRDRLNQTQGVLDTQSTFVHELKEVEAIYRATLTIDANDEGGFLQLTKSWKEEDGHLVEATGPIWHKLEKGTQTAASSLLEACVIDVEDSLSWQFEMQATTPTPSESVSEWYRELGVYYFNIKQKEAENEEGNDMWCEFEKGGNGAPRFVAGKQALDLKTTWQYGIANSDYTVEVTKLQRAQYKGSKTPVSRDEPTVFGARWTVQVMHRNWQVNLAENANAGVGESASWRADLETWFPVDDRAEGNPRPKTEGHIDMMEKLFRLQAIIRGTEK